jgi:hypothetical protein
MARNEEKALTLFSKWQTFKRDFHAGNIPSLPSLRLCLCLPVSPFLSLAVAVAA